MRPEKTFVMSRSLPTGISTLPRRTATWVYVSIDHGETVRLKAVNATGARAAKIKTDRSAKARNQAGRENLLAYETWTSCRFLAACASSAATSSGSYSCRMGRSPLEYSAAVEMTQPISGRCASASSAASFMEVGRRRNLIHPPSAAASDNKRSTNTPIRSVASRMGEGESSPVLRHILRFHE